MILNKVFLCAFVAINIPRKKQDAKIHKENARKGFFKK
jgi:hypothetical protein